MRVRLLTIGDEILIGQIVDTNSAWMAEKLNLLGVKVEEIQSIGDDHNQILRALKDAEENVDILLVTGGLGPTKDDITKNVLAEYFGTKLVFHQSTYDRIVAAFTKRNIPLTELHKDQCFLPESATLLTNERGTAPGMWFSKKGFEVISMPGVPNEMKYLMEYEVIPWLSAKKQDQELFHRTVITAGVGETTIARHIREWEENLAAGLKLAYLPGLGMVRLRISGEGAKGNGTEELVHKTASELADLVGEWFVGFDRESLEVAVGKILLVEGASLGTAESCTGGHIAHKLTSISGSSAYFKGSVIAYSNEMKMKLLAVKSDTLDKYGAVSKETVEEMAIGALGTLNVDYSVAVSGIAGPGGGSAEKPVGLVWIAVAGKNKVQSAEFRFGKDRLSNIRRTTVVGLNMLRKFLLAK